ncbi:MAG: DNA alkylation repair protein, partial [Kangiellaceae bacterium]
MNETSVESVLACFQGLADPKIAEHSGRFFKSAPGEYGEGDQFLGVRVPVIRQQVKKFKKLNLKQSLKLLTNDYHEVRLFAVLKLVDLFEKGTEEEKKKVY